MGRTYMRNEKDRIMLRKNNSMRSYTEREKVVQRKIRPENDRERGGREEGRS